MNVVHGAGGAVYVDERRLPSYEERVLATGPIAYWPGDGDVIYVDGEPQRVSVWDETMALPRDLTGPND